MDIKRVNDLLDLGFSIDEIKALNPNTEQAEQAEQAEQTEQAENVEQVEQTPASEQAPANTELDVSKVFDDAFKQLNSRVEEFNKKMQSLNSTFANIDDSVSERSDADIIASIIKPR